MPIEYKLTRNGTVVMARTSGVISLNCFMSMQKRMKADTNLRDPQDTLLDARTVSHIELTEDDLRVIAQGLTSGPIRLGANRLAIVTDKEQAFVLGDKYYTVEKGVDETVVVFFNIDVARTWLGLDE